MESEPSASPQIETLVLRNPAPWLVATERFLENATQLDRDRFNHATPENLFYETSNAGRNDKMTSKMQSAAQKLKPLVEVIEKYDKAMDVYANASSVITCPLWGSIRVLLLVAQSYGSFFDTIVDGLRHIGEVLSRFHFYQDHYPHSEPLKHALATAYLDIITICTRYRDNLEEQKQTRKFLLPLITPRSSSRSFESIIDIFNRHEENVKIEVENCRMLEATNNSDQLQRNKERQESEDNEQRLRRLLDLLSPVLVEEKHGEISALKHSGSCEWIFTKPEYQSWMNVDRSAVLCCNGIPGCGKSVLASSVVDTLNRLVSKDIPVAYYYCDYLEPVSLEPTTILGSLIRGLLQPDNIPKEIADMIQKYYHDGKRTPKVDETLKILLRVMDLSKKVVLVLDGIDETGHKNFCSVLSLLKTLLVHPGVTVKIFITSREYKDLSPALSPSTKPWFHIQLDQLLISSDINSYINASVKEMIAKNQTILNSSHTQIQEEISQRFIEGAKGMFLWVKYQLDELCQAECEESLMSTLRNLPKDLDETYDRLFARIVISSEKKELIRRMFEWLIAARRPLSEVELCEAMAFTIDDRQWDPKKIPPSLLRIIKAGGNLVVFDKFTNKIRLAHYTVRQYLLRERPIGNYQFSIEKSDEHLAEVCIAYLSFDDFETQVIKYDNDGVIAGMRNLEHIVSSNSPRSPMHPITLHRKLFRRSRDTSSLNIEYSRQFSPRITAVQASFDRFGLLEYAKQHWAYHSTGVKMSFPATSKRDIHFQRLSTGKSLPFSFKPWSTDGYFAPPYTDLVGWAIANNHVPLIRSLEDFDDNFSLKNCIEEAARWFFQHPDQLWVTTEMLETIADCSFDIWNSEFHNHAWIYHKMLIAAQKGNAAILKLGQLHTDPDVSTFPWIHMRSHLIIEAARANQREVIDIYTSETYTEERDFRTPCDGQYCNALEHAALSGHVEMVKKLSKVGWTASNFHDTISTTRLIALEKAIIENNTKVVKALIVALLPNGSVSESLYDHVASAFLSAVSSGHIDMVNVFLDNDFDPTAPYIPGMCPYMQAIEDGNFEIFLKFFQMDGCGIEINVTGLPLTMAVANGRMEIAKYLIDKGANLNGEVPGSTTACPTPLYAASANGQYAAVKLLLDSGAEPDLQSYRAWALRPRTGVVLDGEATASPGYFSLEPQTAQNEIQWLDPRQGSLAGAVLNGHFQVVELLLGAGASANPQDSCGDHPLLLAALGGYSEIVVLLLSKGAKLSPNTRNTRNAIFACSRGYGTGDSLDLIISCGVSIEFEITDKRGFSVIHLAVESGSSEVLKQLIRHGGNVNARDNNSRTPMMIACIHQQLRCAEILIENNADVDSRDGDNFSAVSYACANRSIPILTLLLEAKALVDPIGPSGRTPLIDACLAEDSQTIQVLLDNKANVNAKTTQSLPRIGGNYKHKKVPMPIPTGSTPLMIAAITNDTWTIKALVARDIGFPEKADDLRIHLSILLAADCGNFDAFLQLVELGTNLYTQISSAQLGLLDCAVRGRNANVIGHVIDLHEKGLKLNKVGLCSGQELLSAMDYHSKNGGLLPAAVVSKLKKLIRPIRVVEHETNSLVEDPEDALFD